MPVNLGMGRLTRTAHGDEENRLADPAEREAAARDRKPQFA